MGDKTGRPRAASRSHGRPVGVGDGKARPPRAPKRESKSAGGFLGNLIEEAGKTIIGLGPGLYQTGKAVSLDFTDSVLLRDHDYKRTRKVGAAVGKNYSHTYGPLVRGDVDGFWDRLYESPLGPLLDIATVVTWGAGAATKTGLLAKAGGRSIELRSPRALVAEGKLGASAPTIAKQTEKVKGVREGPAVLKGRPLSDNPAIRGRQLLVDKALKSLPPETPLLGEWARYGRALSQLKRRDSMKLEAALVPYQRGYGKLSKHERTAYDLLARWPLPRLMSAQLDAWRAGDEVAQTFAKAASNPKVAKLYEQPTPRMLETLEAARDAGRVMAELLDLDPEVVAQRPYLHLRLASGGRFRPEGLGAAFEPDAGPRLQESFFGTEVGQVAAPGEVALGALVRPVDRGNVGRVVAHDPQAQITRVHFVNRKTGAEHFVTFRTTELKAISAEDASRARTYLEGGDTIDSLRAELEAQGRPLPVYDPDSPVIVPSPFQSARAAGGGKALPRRPGEARQSEGVLAQLGMLALGLDTLSPAYRRSLRYALYGDLYDGLVAAAVRVPKDGARLPDGYEWLRRPIGPGKAETIPMTAKVRGEALDQLEELLPDPSDSRALADGFTVRKGDDFDATVAQGDGFYLAVPKTLVKQAVGEFQKAGKVMHYLVNKPTTVWRVLVLNLRPGWLVNNILGTNFLLAYRYLGPKLLRAYAASIRELGKDTAPFRRLVADYFPEHGEAGTFIGSQLPEAGRLGRAAKIAGAGLAPADRALEGVARRSALRVELRKNPAVRKRLKDMPRETRSFETAARRALDADPDLARRISQNVNDALGDYLALSAFERTYVRAVLPFWSWYRAIATVAARMPLDTPGRANLLYRLGQVGAEQQDPDFPLSLQGLIPLEQETGPDGRRRVINTIPMNPLSTLVDLARAGSGLAAGKPGDAGEVLSGVNPFVAAPAEFLFGRDMQTGAPVRGRGLPLSILENVYASLPQVRLAEALGADVPGYTLSKGSPGKPTLYERSAFEELIRYLGASGGRISPSRARQLKKDR